MFLFLKGGSPKFKIFPISNFSQIRSEGGGSSNLQFFSNSKKSKRSIPAGVKWPKSFWPEWNGTFYKITPFTITTSLRSTIGHSPTSTSGIKVLQKTEPRHRTQRWYCSAKSCSYVYTAVIKKVLQHTRSLNNNPSDASQHAKLD